MVTGYANLIGDNPYLKLTGTEGSNDPVGIREKAGNFEVYDVSGDDAILTIAVSTGDAVVAGGLTVTTAKTDGQMGVPVAPGVSLNGTWTVTNASSVITVTRTAATQADYYMIPLPFMHRTTASKGVKITSYKASYVTTAGTTSDIIQFWLQKQALPADASGATGAILAGDDNADYDTNHNTEAKRYAAASHTLTVTVPTGEQAFIADGEQHYIVIKVDDDASADLTFALTGLVVNYTVAAL